MEFSVPKHYGDGDGILSHCTGTRRQREKMQCSVSWVMCIICYKSTVLIWLDYVHVL